MARSSLAARTRSVLYLAAALAAAPVRAGAEGLPPAALPPLAAAPGAWWPPVAPEGAAGSFLGWAVSKDGPMAMPPAVRDLLYSPQSSLARIDKLRTLLERIWEHLGSRVDELADWERRSELLDKEIGNLAKKGLEGDTVLMALIRNVDDLHAKATARSEELTVKFDQVMAYREKLKTGYRPQAKEIDVFFNGLKGSRAETEKRYRTLGSRVDRMRVTLRGIQGTRADQIRSVAKQAATRKATPPASPAPKAASRPAPEVDPDLLLPPEAPPEPTRPASPPPAKPAKAAPGASELYTDSGRRKTAKELIEARTRENRAARRGKTRNASSPTPPPPRTAGPDDWADPTPPPATAAPGPVPGDAPLTAPDADRLLDEFLNDPKVLDKYSRRPDAAARGGLELATRELMEAPPAPGNEAPAARSELPHPGDRDLAPFERNLQAELDRTARQEGITPGRGYRDAGGLPRATEPAKPWSVRDIVAELESLEP